uniref:Uncharacterized protein n=1 Tax=Arundo donax TaxID=35708 RepID=A0A0A9HBN2_ARUDO
MYVETEQNIVKPAGSTSDFVNGSDMNSSSIPTQMLLQNFQVTTVLDKEVCATGAAEERPVQQPVLEKEERSSSLPAAEQPARPAAHGSQRKQLLLAIAITGIAVLIGSIMYQKKG